MKNFSLMLAISALLYGTSATYVVADEPIVDTDGFSEDGTKGHLDGALGLEPFLPLPDNIFVNNDNPYKATRMCDKSFRVDGAEMAVFPVVVTYVTAAGDEVVEEVLWQVSGVPNGGEAVGNGWSLVQIGSTWNQQWQLYTDGVAVKKIVLKPIIDSDGDKIKHGFDIGGSTGDVPEDEHTSGAARGKPIQMKLPPDVDFTATYSRPVYVTHTPAGDPNLHPHDSTVVDHDPNATPTHDLYGQLTIVFSDPVESATLGGAAFRFIADTDCVLPVKEAKMLSYLGDILTFTLKGKGNVVLRERCGSETNDVSGLFPIDYRDDEKEFSTQLTLRQGCYYSAASILDNGDIENSVPLDGVPTNAYNEYYVE